MKWNKAYADVDKMKRALMDGDCVKDEAIECLDFQYGWRDVLVMRPWTHPEDHFDSYNFFVASYYIVKGKGLWSSKALMCLPLSEEEVRDTDMWAVIETPKEE